MGEVKRPDYYVFDMGKNLKAKRWNGSMPASNWKSVVLKERYDTLKAERDKANAAFDELSEIDNEISDALDAANVIKGEYQGEGNFGTYNNLGRVQALISDLTRHKEMYISAVNGRSLFRTAFKKARSEARWNMTIVTQLQRAQKASDELKDKEIQDLKSKLEKAVEALQRIDKFTIHPDDFLIDENFKNPGARLFIKDRCKEALKKIAVEENENKKN